ncbi:MAG: hypothetical protein P8Z35_25725, partial [Ignavibacteriaceae bacterium]
LKDILRESTVQINYDKKDYSPFLNWLTDIGEEKFKANKISMKKAYRIFIIFKTPMILLYQNAR